MYEDLIFYQIYPKSFCDSNRDGIGDLQGILSKVPYLKELGVNAVWLSPCFKSPFADNGYDISDYRDIDESFGSMEDFKILLKTLHENGIKLILDFVANHTSSEHFWFKEARKSKDNPYRDYYIWRKTPPNDWESCFGGTAWQYDELTQEYYLHSYAVEQPDLNWDNPRVREEMCAVIDFWIDMGVDGFRCDVLDNISKDCEKGINSCGTKLHEYINQLFGREKTKSIFTVGECWSTNKENVSLYCDKDRRELTTVFCFNHLITKGGRFFMKKPPLYQVCKEISDWQLLTQEVNVLPPVFIENHDQPRSVSRFGDDKERRYECATFFGGLVLMHKGIPFIYQGQEIGMTNYQGRSLKDFNDVESRWHYNEYYDTVSKEELLTRINYGGRDNPRVMMPWTGEKVKSWQADYTRREEINVENDLSSSKSIFAFYKKLIALRKAEKALTKGKYKLCTLTSDEYRFERIYKEDKITVCFSLEKGKEISLPNDCEILIDNYQDTILETKPYRLVVFKSKI